MLAAPSYEVVEQTLRSKFTPIIGLLFAPPFTATGAEVLVPRLGYLDHRSGQHIHFFCAGYGGYEFAADQRPIAEMRYENGTVIPWGFSDRKYAEFVGELEARTRWKPQGEAELILVGSELNFADTVVFDIEAMVADGAIRSAGRLMESVIDYARAFGERATPADISDRAGAKLLGRKTGSMALDFLPSSARELWTEGRHYVSRNLSR